MSLTPSRSPWWLAAAVLVAGCGMEASDTTIRTRGEVGVPDDGPVIEVLETEFVCPHLIPIDNREFKTADVKQGEVEGRHGPMVPCGERVPQGAGLCPNCKNPYHTDGAQPIAVCTNLRLGDKPSYEPGQPILVDIPVVVCNEELGTWHEGSAPDCPACRAATEEWSSSGVPAPPWSVSRAPKQSAPALWQFRCPFEDCAKVIDPVHLQVRKHPQVSEEEKRWTDRHQAGMCPDCKRYFWSEPTDVLEAVPNPEQVICPACYEPVDPTMNVCTNEDCPLDGVVFEVQRPNDQIEKVVGNVIRNVETVIGPCWRCGGVKVCPSCDGASTGDGDLYPGAGLPMDCWYCQTWDPVARTASATGLCPECDDTGFVAYTGSLPEGFHWIGNVRGSIGPLPSASRGWEHQDAAARDVEGEEPAPPQ